MSVFARDVGVDAAVALVLEFVPERGRVAGYVAAYSLFLYCMLLRCLMRLTVLLTASFLCQCCAGENRYDDYNQKA
jgi:hypothetical protein